MLKRLPRGARAPDPSSSPSPSSESALLERIRAGDEQAFEHLFRSYYQPLCDFVMSYVRSRETAEELVQTVFLRLWEKREDFTPAAGVAAYLFAACRNRSLDHLKHQSVVARAGDQGGLSGEPESGVGVPPLRPDEAAQVSELTHAIRRAVQQLPERCRAVAILRWEHQLSHLEIARALGVSVKGVEAHLSRARAVLRKSLAAFEP
ncbi:MAG: RNA polymerase sigma-70 factor [Gemmatimonadales bacterium]